MNGGHPELGELGPELRRLAQAMLDAIDPAVRAAANLAPSDGPGKCQQAWCPVCALAAMATGEEHPMLTAVAEHSVALLAVIRAAVEQTSQPPEPEPPRPDGGPGPGSDQAAKTGYQHIPVTIEE